MARNREKKISLNHQVKLVMDSQLAIGQSKFDDKLNNQTKNKIYSWSTYRTYLKHNIYFVEWAKKNYNIKSLDEGKKYVNEWLEFREKEGLSSYTLKLESSALVKLYNLDSSSLYKVKNRARNDIQRSRGEKIRDTHFSEKNNEELVIFCKSTGLRRCELSQIRGTDLFFKGKTPFLKVSRNTKGGRVRNVPLVINTELIVQLLEKAGENKLFSKISSNADIHGYRGDFAKNLYKLYARDINNIPKEDRYHCRKDLKGICYDKKAMKIVTEALGHSRIDVIAGHYINK